MNSEPKMHHYIPQFYLAGFTSSGKKDGYLWVFDTSNGNIFKSKPRNVGKQKDFYKLDINEIDNNIVEYTFAMIEDGTAPIIKNIIKNNELPKGEDFKILIYFLALLAMRTPAFRNTISNLLRDIARKTAEISLSTKERFESIQMQMIKDGYDINDELSYEEMREFIFSDRYDIKVSKSWQIYWILETVDIILPMLHKRNWSLVKIHDLSFGNFICSDRPVSLTWIYETGAFLPPGFALRETIVLMPLNRSLMLAGTFENIKKKARASLKTIADLNSRICFNTERFIYASNNKFIYIKPDGIIGDSDYLMEQYRGKNES